MTGVGGFTSPAGRDRYLLVYDEAMNQCPTPDATLDVETRHGTTRVYRFGRGDEPVIALLPALMAPAACYRPLIPALAARCRVYALDMLGEAGRSVQTSSSQDLPDRARCLDEVLDRIGLTDVHLVGHSTGGWHAMNFSALRLH